MNDKEAAAPPPSPADLEIIGGLTEFRDQLRDEIGAPVPPEVRWDVVTINRPGAPAFDVAISAVTRGPQGFTFTTRDLADPLVYPRDRVRWGTLRLVAASNSYPNCHDFNDTDGQPVRFVIACDPVV